MTSRFCFHLFFFLVVVSYLKCLKWFLQWTKRAEVSLQITKHELHKLLELKFAFVASRWNEKKNYNELKKVLDSFKPVNFWYPLWVTKYSRGMSFAAHNTIALFRTHRKKSGKNIKSAVICFSQLLCRSHLSKFPSIVRFFFLILHYSWIVIFVWL